MWDLTNANERISGYDATAFQGDTTYNYNGLTLVGHDTSAKINQNGMYINKASSSTNNTNIVYKPDMPGILSVSAKIAATTSGTKYYTSVYVDESIRADKNKIITGDSNNNGTIVTGSTDLEAGKTYYIYGASSAGGYISKLTFTPVKAAAYGSFTANGNSTNGTLQVKANAEISNIKVMVNDKVIIRYPSDDTRIEKGQTVNFGILVRREISKDDVTVEVDGTKITVQ